ncbi:carboxypeptidase-like regulatory domain-containing protein [Pontibacter sp. E15-1]|uniref:carboxypeptidase-like regulatory domain-containing protein n=1 Tax=Pontibacter sp. E15-1 TaxID=2919918 RepID=UPI001F5010AD|nr:carboxypeptidase-like regulatory domain-containing protein [Pontibacter sp. E15-1]MCJ8163938.1 carboxypeptidase-like regulatory domain-containing protein [Pontibacter sp. E15-1]
MTNLLRKENRFALHNWLGQHMAYLLLLVAAVTYAGSNPAYAQQATVTGTVTDAGGDPLPGATVVVKGTTNGVTTSGNGAFTLSVPNRTGVLVVSFLGFTTKEVPLNGQSTVNISLGTDAKALEEVVIIGYGSQKRSDVTGALSSVSAKEIKDQPVARVDQALQGKAAGVVIQNNNAAPKKLF